MIAAAIIAPQLSAGIPGFRGARATRLPAGAKWHGRRVVRIGCAQQGIDLDAERPRQAVQHVNGRVPNAALNTAQVRRGDTGIDRERLLRQPACSAQQPQVPREAPPSAHAVQARNLTALIHELSDMDYVGNRARSSGLVQPVEGVGPDQADGSAVCEAAPTDSVTGERSPAARLLAHQQQHRFGRAP